MRGKFVLGVLSTVCMAAFTVLQALPAAAADDPVVLRLACAAKSNGVLRHTPTASGCTKQETLVTLSVAAPSELCATGSTVHLVSKTNTCSKQLKGVPLSVPTATAVYFCAQPGAVLRRVSALTQCSATDLKLVSVNNPPTGLALSPSVVTENVPTGTLVGTVSATDNDPGDALQFALTAGAGSQDNASFVLSGTQLRTAAAVDFESKPSYSVRLLATDAGGLSQAQAVTITVTDVQENRAPTGISLSNGQVAENTATTVGTLTTTDADAGDTFTYTLTSGTTPNDNGLFSITGTTLSTTGLDHEGAGPEYVVTVQTDDGHGGTFVRDLTVTATNVNEAPTALAVNPSTVAENGGGGTVGTLSASDPDGDSLTFLLVSGTGDADNAAFTVAGSDLVARNGLDFEHGPYAVRVRGTDGGGLSTTAALTVFVTDGNDSPTGITLEPGTVTENQPAGASVGTLSAADQDAGDSITFAVTGGATGLFTVDGDQLRTSQPLDHEAAGTRTVVVRADDGHGGTVEATLTVTVTDVNEGPSSVSLSPAQVAENQPAGTTVGTLSSQDPDGPDTPGYALVAGTGDAGNGAFQVVGDTLRTAGSFDFEQTNTYSIRVRVTDSSGATADQVFTVVVTDVNEAPQSLALTGTTVAENQASGTTVGTTSSVDPDAGDSATYSLPAGSADNARFSLTGSTLKTAAVFDYETTSSYTVLVRVVDGGGLARQETFTVTVLDGNDAPTAVADTYSGVVGNTRAVLGTTSTGAHTTLTGDLPTQNDVDPEGDTLSAVAETRSTTGGGTVTINSDGSFVYSPGVGDRSQTDTFTYRVTDGEFTSPATVSITIGSEMVWYVDNAATGPGDGRSHTPYTSTTQVNGFGDADGPGDIIFVASSATAYAPLTLESSQRLWGQPEGLTVSGAELLPGSGVNPLIAAVDQTALQLVSGNDVRRVDVQATGFGSIGVVFFGGNLSFGANTRVSASGSSSRAFLFQPSSAGTALIGAAIEGVGGAAVQVTSNGAAASMTFAGPVVGTNASVEVNNVHADTVVNFTGGVAIDNTDRPGLAIQTGGVVTVTGAANVVRTTTGRAVAISNSRIGAAGVTLQRVDADGAPSSAVMVNNTGTLGSFVVTGNSSGRCGGLTGSDGSRTTAADASDCSGGTVQHVNGFGYELVNTLQPRLTRVRVLDTAASGIYVTGTNGFTLRSSWIKDNGANLSSSVNLGGFQGDFGGAATIVDTTVEASRYNGIAVRGVSPVTAVLTGNQVIGAARFGMDVNSRGANTYDADVSRNYYADNISNVVAGADHVVTSGNMRITIADNTMDPPNVSGGGRPISVGGNVSSFQAGVWAGVVRYTIERNRMVGGSSGGITAFSNQGAPTGVVEGVIRDNVIGRVDLAGSCGDQQGIQVYAATGVNTALVTRNTLSQCRSVGIGIDRQALATTADVTVTDNSVTSPSGAFAIYGLLLRSDNNGVTPGCFDLRNNRLEHGPFAGVQDMSVRTNGATPARLPGYVGVPTSTTAISSFVGGQNYAASVETVLSTGGSFIGGGACAAPTP
ncbi:beta strand repeat-containing protein [Oryzobacter telluris]|uniref:beta strand repeat-containing protein n=1 Tax=Oryzobacter telluris TaxID=3149179 RepID=UPI00370D1BFB